MVVGRVGMMMRVVDNKLKQMRVRGMQIARVMWTMGTMGAEMVIVEEKGGEGVTRENCQTTFIKTDHITLSHMHS